MIDAIDLFCGAGGLTAGFEKAGLNVLAGYDSESECRYPYSQNNRSRFLLRDVSELKVDELRNLFSSQHHTLLAGCAPCQPFSTYTQAKEAKKNPSWPLMSHFSRLISGVEPDFVTMENVPYVTKHEIYHEFLDSLRSLPEPYYVWAGTVECVNYGIPQRRKRHVLLASKHGPIELVGPTHSQALTVRDAISSMPTLSAGERDKTDAAHMAAGMSDLNIKRIKASKPGGTWKDWPDHLIAACHRKDSGKGYSGIYGRMEWDKPSPTITTLCHGYGNGRFGHPEEDRGLSLREAAILQTFPRNYIFCESGKKPSIKVLGKLIGNAVPVRLGEIIAESFKNHVTKHGL